VLYAQQWCRTPEDVVQEAFLRLIQEPKEPENVVAWLYRVVRHRALNATRSAVRRARRESEAAVSGEVWFEPWCEQLAADEATETLKRLPIEQREVIVARLWGGLSFQEVADLTGTSLSTAYRRYQAGLEALRERLGVECPENETRQHM
jgi:RNA polymerase sigma-70 factor (ECF subfamily)